MKEIEHGLHPSTYLPRTQVPETDNSCFAPCPNATASTRSSTSGSGSGRSSIRRRSGSWGASRGSRVSSRSGSSPSIASTASRAAGTTCWPRCAGRARRTGCGRRTSPTRRCSRRAGRRSGSTSSRQAGLIAREPDPQDRRGVLIALTDNGLRGDRRHDRGASGERAPAARRAQRGRAAPARRPAAQAPARAAGLMEIRLFTDPACPFAFSAEPSRWRLRWHYGEQLTLAADDDRADAGAGGGGEAGRRARRACSAATGCRSTPRPYPRPASSEPACRAVVAARLNAPAAEAGAAAAPARAGDGGRAARRPGADRRRRDRRRPRSGRARPLVRDARGAGRAAPRTSGPRARPSRAARALDHKLGGPPEERRYTAPSYEIGDFALARLPPGRGLRGGDRQRRARADAPRRSRSRSRRCWRGRASRSRPPRSRRSWAATRRSCAPRSRGSLSRSRPAPTASGGSEARARCAAWPRHS